MESRKSVSAVIAALILSLQGCSDNSLISTVSEAESIDYTETESGEKYAQTDTSVSEAQPSATEEADYEYEVSYSFRNDKYLKEHFEKHKNEFSFVSADEYVEGANSVIVSPDALHKTEEEDGDDIYYLEETNEFVVVSTDGYIRTYFKPSRGIQYYYDQ